MFLNVSIINVKSWRIIELSIQHNEKSHKISIYFIRTSHDEILDIDWITTRGIRNDGWHYHFCATRGVTLTSGVRCDIAGYFPWDTVRSSNIHYFHQWNRYFFKPGFSYCLWSYTFLNNVLWCCFGMKICEQNCVVTCKQNMLWKHKTYDWE